MTAPEPFIRPVMPELDTVRGVAILMVVLFHGFYWSNGLDGLSGVAREFVSVTRFGWLGVNLFFVLSGFLITGILVRSRRERGYYRTFYLRRALRILPVYYTVLAVLLVMPSQSRSYIGLSVVYLSNIAPLFGIVMTYPMLWSLAVEEHFYLIWPLVVRKLDNRVLGLCAVTIILLSPILRAAAFVVRDAPGSGGLTWLVADGLASGALLAIFVRDRRCTRETLAWASASAICFSGILVATGAPFGILSTGSFMASVFKLTGAHIFFFGVLGLVLLCGTSEWKFIVNRPILDFFGNISYGLYLVHWLCFSAFDRLLKNLPPIWHPDIGRFRFLWLRFALSAGVATLIAFLSRRYFEEPFLKLKNRFS